MVLQKNVAALLGATITGIVVMSMVWAVLVTSRTIPNNGSVTAVGVLVYWDSGCTNQTTSINWGTVDPNSTKSYTIYIKNNGTAPERLGMTTTGWTPSGAQSSISLAWNRGNYLLNPSATVSAILTLSVSSSVSVVDFNFNIVITGTEE